MINEVIKATANAYQNEKEEWLKDILITHCNLEYKGKYIRNLDLERIKFEYNLEIKDDNKELKAYVNGDYVGKWSSGYHFDLDKNKITLQIDKWIK